MNSSVRASSAAALLAAALASCGCAAAVEPDSGRDAASIDERVDVTTFDASLDAQGTDVPPDFETPVDGLLDGLDHYSDGISAMDTVPVDCLAAEPDTGVVFTTIPGAPCDTPRIAECLEWAHRLLPDAETIAGCVVGVIGIERCHRAVSCGRLSDGGILCRCGGGPECAVGQACVRDPATNTYGCQCIWR